MARREIQGELVGHLDEHDARLAIAVVAQENLTFGNGLRLGTIRMDLGDRRRLASPCVIVQKVAVDAERLADGFVRRVRDVAHRTQSHAQQPSFDAVADAPEVRERRVIPERGAKC